MTKFFHNDKHLNEVLRKSSVAFVIKIAGTAAKFGYNVLLARMLGASGTGVYFLALTVATIASVAGRFGMDNALLRFAAANAAQTKWGVVADLHKKGLGITLVLSSVMAVLTFFAARPLAVHVFADAQLILPLKLMAISIVPFSLLKLYSELLRALKKIKESAFIQDLAVPLFSAPLLLILGTRFGAVGAAAAYTASTFILLLIAAWLWRRATPMLHSATGYFDTGLLLRTSLPLFWVAMLFIAMSWTDTLLLGIWLDNRAVGIYGIAMRVSVMISFVLVSVNSIIAPKFAALHADGALRELGDLARRAARLMAVITMPFFLLFLLLPKWVLGIFGDDFGAGATVLAILSVGQFVNVATGSVGYLLIMSGHEKLIRNSTMISAALNLILNVLLIPRFGIIGAAIASATSLAALNLISAALVYNSLSIMTLPVPRRLLRKSC